MIKYIVIFLAVCLAPAYAVANPTHGGSSGLINVPSAETLDAGNICIGAWSCYSDNKHFSQKSSSVLPVSLTLGIGTFWEIYGSYPNILFNGDEDVSSMGGSLDIGTKLRFWGNRTAPFKVAADFLVQRHVSEVRTNDGVTDLSSKLIASFNTDAASAHITAGYVIAGSIADTKRDNGYTFGVGADYMLIPRLKLLGEFTAETNHHYFADPPATSSTSMEISAGAQYYLSPHLTLNTSIGTGLGPHDPSIKFIFGISSCQGIGSYVKPIPSIGRRATVKDKTKEALKPLKIIPISTLLLKSTAAKISPASTLEVEVKSDEEEFLIKPYGQILIAPQQASSNLTSPVIPVQVAEKANDDDVPIVPPKDVDQEVVAVEYTVGRLYGVTPLYGVDVKGVSKEVSKIGTISEADIALAKKVKLYRKFKLTDDMYELDSSTLSKSGKKMLSEVAEKVRTDNKWSFIRVDGHTDSSGSLIYNMELSLKRAVAAATYLVSNEGVDASKVFVKGFGKTIPIADNASAEGRSKNRRTEILLYIANDDK